MFFIDDGPGKAVGINLFIGKQPIAAFGNSTRRCRDAAMDACQQPGARLMMLVYHDECNSRVRLWSRRRTTRNSRRNLPRGNHGSGEEGGLGCDQHQEGLEAHFLFDK